MQKAIAIISDIHSNFEALTAVLEDVKSQQVSKLVCLGDIVGYAAGVRSCLRAVRDLGCPVVLGNHDEAACLPEPPEEFNDTAYAGIEFAASRLTKSARAWMTSLPRNLEFEGTSFTHASLADPREWEYILSSEDARRHFAVQSHHLAFCGHTHKPMVWWEKSPVAKITCRKGKDVITLSEGGKVLVNVGAVGQPRDGDCRACYVVHRPQQNTVEFRRVPYDIKRTKRKIVRAGLPRFTAQRLSLGR